MKVVFAYENRVKVETWEADLSFVPAVGNNIYIQKVTPKGNKGWTLFKVTDVSIMSVEKSILGTNPDTGNVKKSKGLDVSEIIINLVLVDPKKS